MQSAKKITLPIFVIYFFSALSNAEDLASHSSVANSLSITSNSSLMEDEPIKKIKGKDIIIHSTNSEGYPLELSSKGINGEILLSAYILKSGEISEIKIKNTSHSKELDQAAIDYLSKNIRAKPSNHETQFDVVLIFTKGINIADMFKLTCSDVLPDILYYQSANPDKKVSGMFLMQSVFGTLMIVNMQKNHYQPIRSDEEATLVSLKACEKDSKITFTTLIHYAVYGKELKN